MSVQSQVTDFLSTLAKGAEGPVTITPEQMALQMGLSRDKVNKTLSNLKARKRIELLRGKNGRDIIGYRMLEAPPDRRRRTSRYAEEDALARAEVVHLTPVPPHTNGQTNGKVTPTDAVRTWARRGRQVYTPQLDAYVAARKKFAILTEELGDRIEATFREDPLAEEGLLLKERLLVVEEQLHEYRQRAEEAERERDALRTRHVQATTRKAVEAGAIVQHSDPND